MIRQPNKVAKQLVASSRPQNVVYSGLLCSIIILTTGGTAGSVIWCYVSLVILYALAATINNIKDIETDRLNKRLDNPLLQKTIGRKDLQLFLVAACVGLALIQTRLQQPYTLLLTGGYIVLLLSYSLPPFSLQKRGFVAHIVLSICYGTIPVLLGASQTNNTHAYLVAALQIPLLVPLLLAKDYKDIIGDTKTGKRTPLVRYGSKVVRNISYLIAVCNVILLGLLVTMRNLSIYAVLPAVIYVFCVIKLHQKKGKMSGYFLRIPQLALLLLSYILLSASL